MQILKSTVQQLHRSCIFINLTGPGVCSHNACIQTSMKMNAKIGSQLVDPVLRAEGVQTVDFLPHLERQGRKKSH